MICPITSEVCECPIQCDPRILAPIGIQLSEFAAERERLLRGKPIDPEGEEALMGDVR